METELLQTQGADDSSTSSKLVVGEAPSEGMAKPVEVPPVPQPAIMNAVAELVEELSNAKNKEQADASPEYKPEDVFLEDSPIVAPTPQSEVDVTKEQPSSSQAPVAAAAGGTSSVITPKRHMSGAAVRRMKHYLRIGMSREEARIKAQTPYKLLTPMQRGGFGHSPSVKRLDRLNWQDRQAFIDRMRSVMTWRKPPEQAPPYQLVRPLEIPVKKKVEKAAVEESPAVEDVDGPLLPEKDSIMLGIALVGYPFEILSTEQADIIKQAILDHIIAEAGAMKPTFNKLLYKNGWLSLACANAQTAQWMRATFHKLKIWPGGRLRILDDSECYGLIFRGVFPNSQNQDNNKILSLIAAQNKIDTTNWKIIGRQSADKDGFVFLSIEPRAIEQLQSRKFILNFGFGRVKLKDTLKGIEDCIQRRPGGRPPPPPRPPPRAQFSNPNPRSRALPPKHSNLGNISPWGGSKPSPWGHKHAGPWMANESGPWAANGPREPWASNRGPCPQQQFTANESPPPLMQNFNGPPDFRGSPQSFEGPSQDYNPVWQPPAYQRRSDNNNWLYSRRTY